jgi:hypothetical protein
MHNPLLGGSGHPRRRGTRAMGSRFADFWRQLSWSKIVGETMIIVVGVFLGIQASNWNDERLEQQQNIQVLRGLKPELGSMIVNFQAVVDYYGTTRKYADTAFAGWRGDPGISDRDFVIAAYQASQNSFTSMNVGSWATIFGSDRLRNLDDEELRANLSILMTTDYDVVEKEIFTDYRQRVRKVIPEDIQDAIRAECGDYRPGNLGMFVLPEPCSLQMPQERFATAARALRQSPELVGELRWHFAAVATYVENIKSLQQTSRTALKLIEKI